MPVNRCLCADNQLSKWHTRKSADGTSCVAMTRTASSASASAFIQAEIKMDTFPLTAAWRPDQHATCHGCQTLEQPASFNALFNRNIKYPILRNQWNSAIWYRGSDTSMWSLKLGSIIYQRLRFCVSGSNTGCPWTLWPPFVDFFGSRQIYFTVWTWV